MRELFEICPKIQFFNFFGAFVVNLVGKAVKALGGECKIVCSYVSGQPGKIPCLSPEKMTIFPHLALFPTCSSQKSGTPTDFKITFFEKYKNRTIITQRFILTPSNLSFLGAFEKYLFFMLVLTIISEKHMLSNSCHGNHTEEFLQTLCFLRP